MRIYLASTQEHAQLWQRFVDTHSACSNHHRWGWKQVIEASFHWPTFYFMAGENTEVKGILPLVWQRNQLFGSFLTSLPFLNGGGAVAESRDVEAALIQEAIALARRLRVDHLELRYRNSANLELPTRTNKVVVVRPVESDRDKMWNSLLHKVRTDIRKSMKSGLTAEFGGEELLNDFYKVFCLNMRDLGTPVYGRGIFREILRTFPDDSYFCIVRHNGEPIAASFLTGYRDTLEAAWSSSSYGHLSVKPNMCLYWNILCFAGRKGYQLFDFGRSTVGSGTHRFKMQWGSREVPLCRVYWLRKGTKLPELNPENPRYRLAIWVWQRLPLVITNLLGPRIARALP